MDPNPGSVNGLREFGPFRLDAAARVLWLAGEIVDLPPKAVDVLCVLTDAPGQVVSKAELIERVWPESFVEEGNLTHQIYELRKAFKAAGCTEEFIQTVPRRGYRFAEPVSLAYRGDAEIVVDRRSISKTLIAELIDHDEPEPAAVPTPTPPMLPGRSRRFTPGAAFAVVLAAVALGLAAYLYMRPAAAPPQGIKSLAVLPLQTIGGDDQDRTLALGLTYALISQLGRSEHLVVRPFNSASTAAGPAADPAAAGRELQVDAVVDWTLQRAAGRIRVSARLLLAADGRQIWSETFDSSESDIFLVQDAVSARTARSLIDNISAAESSRISARGTDNNEAYNAYLRGRYHWNTRTRAGFEAALGFFEQAVTLDPRFADAHAGLADVHLGFYDYGFRKAADAVPHASASVNRSLQLDPGLADAWSTLASIELLHGRDWAAAERDFKKAVELAPNDPTHRLRYGWMLSVAGRHDEGREQLTAAERLDPTSRIGQANLAYNSMVSGRLDDAEARLVKLKTTAPDFSLPYWYLGTVYNLQGRGDESIREYFRAFELDEGRTDTVERIRSLYHSGSPAAAFKLWYAELEARYAREYFPPSNIALVAALARDRDSTLRWLKEADRIRDPWLLQVVHDPEYRFLKDDAEFRSITAALGAR